MATSKSANGKVNSENIRGAKVPTKGGLKDETGGKGLGSRFVKPRRTVVNFANRGR
jgi:hypothetical protein